MPIKVSCIEIQSVTPAIALTVFFLFVPFSLSHSIFTMTRITTTLLIAASAVLLSSSVEGFSPVFRPQVRSGAQVASPTELWAKKKKKKNKKKKKTDGAGTAVLERPPAVVAEAEVEAEAIPPAIFEDPPIVIEESEATVVEGELEDPAVKMIANEMFQRQLLEQRFAYEAMTTSEPEAEPEPEPEPVAEASEPEPEPEPEPVAEVVEPEPEPQPEDLAAKYAAIDDVGERAYQILKDLGMFDRD